MEATYRIGDRIVENHRRPAAGTAIVVPAVPAAVQQYHDRRARSELYKTGQECVAEHRLRATLDRARGGVTRPVVSPVKQNEQRPSLIAGRHDSDLVKTSP